jgi:hypothetical protein
VSVIVFCVLDTINTSSAYTHVCINRVERSQAVPCGIITTIIIIIIIIIITVPDRLMFQVVRIVQRARFYTICHAHHQSM